MRRIVFDLDGTLADNRHRLHLIRGEDQPVNDWDEYERLCELDPPVELVVELWGMYARDNHTLEIWTGRSEGKGGATRDRTMRWLRTHVSGWVHIRELRMRPHGFYLPNHELKRRWYVEADRKPDLILEDDPAVVEMWTAMGVPCFHVTPAFYTEEPSRLEPKVK